jgi:hypothetical protein
MPVDARRLIRKMRGGAQAHLIEAADGHSYVVKFLNNPQHRRILVNEWIASVFLRYLGIAAPEAAVINLSAGFLASNPEVYIQLGDRREEVAAGWHYGSRFPGDPLRMNVFDYLPDTLLSEVENLSQFAAVLAFDKWMGNADSRQAIFFRARLLEPAYQAPDAEPRVGFVAQMIDHGFIFEGPQWRFGDSAVRGLYFRPRVYAHVRGLADFEPWLERIRYFPEQVVDLALRGIPRTWIGEDQNALERLLEQLLRRRARVAGLLEACRADRSNPFPAWR